MDVSCSHGMRQYDDFKTVWERSRSDNDTCKTRKRSGIAWWCTSSTYCAIRYCTALYCPTSYLLHCNWSIFCKNFSHLFQFFVFHIFKLFYFLFLFVPSSPPPPPLLLKVHTSLPSSYTADYFLYCPLRRLLILKLNLIWHICIRTNTYTRTHTHTDSARSAWYSKFPVRFPRHKSDFIRRYVLLPCLALPFLTLPRQI